MDILKIEMMSEFKETHNIEDRYLVRGKWKIKKEIPNFWDGTWVTGPSGNDIRLDSPHMRDSDTEQEWSIFRLLFQEIAKDMESQGWQL